ncbi:carboxypeptidase regulatory-like domain-containing protein [Sanguibacter sp. A247]|uniref:carboxypeptidase regulatory-like domain-containing protein n=1 Tax=unclassified Sanguibacter TaxID=2645534 RepID=UPI003FD7EF8B
MRAELTPAVLDGVPGSPAYVSVVVTNTSEVIAAYDVRVLGVDPRWVEVDGEPRLFPGTTGTVRIALTLPVGVAAGPRRLAVQVRATTTDDEIEILDLTVHVPATPGLRVRLDPTTVTGGRRGILSVEVANEGNTRLMGRLHGVDPEAATRFVADPATFDLAPGEHLAGRVELRARRAWFGSPVVRQIEVHASDDLAANAPDPGSRPLALGAFVQRPRFSRGLLSMLGLLAAVSVFAVVISVGLGSVLARSEADRNLAITVAQARDRDVTIAGTGTLAGRVMQPDGAPLTGVSVDVTAADDATAVVASTASDDAGAFRVGGLASGEYKLRLRGAGFAEVWYPAALSDADAEPIELSGGRTVDGLTVMLGGTPATIAGTVSGPDVAGARVELQVPLDVLAADGAAPSATPGEGDGAVLRTSVAGSDGAFLLTSVPSPGVYDLVVSKEGFSAQVHRLDVGAGEDRQGVEIDLRTGDGAITGIVSSAAGPVAGATVVATWGTTVVRTLTQTEGEDAGTFTLRDLPTPATFTVQVSHPGLASETLALDLARGQQLDGVAVSLGVASGSVAGLVTVPQGTSPGGVLVTVTDGAVTRQTVTTTKPAGAWRVAGLPVPSTYTVTLSRADLGTQVVSVSLDATGAMRAGGAATSSVRTPMRAARGALVGTVSQKDLDGNATRVGGVAVTLTSGATTLRVRTATTEADRGEYVVENLEPGTWSVTFERRGTRPVSTTVTVTAGTTTPFDPVLVAPASLAGTVTSGGAELVGVTARLWTAAAYGTGQSPVATTTTNGEGAFRFEDVDAPATYIVEIVSSQGSVLAASAVVTVTQSQAAHLAVTVEAP